MKWNKTFLLLIIIFSSLFINAQNVGIGVSNPMQKLHVGGNIRIDSLAGSGTGVITTNANGDLGKISLTGNASDVLRGDGSFGTLPSAGLPTGAIVGSATSNNQSLLNAGFSLHGELNSVIANYLSYPSIVSEQYMELPMYETGDPNKTDAPEARANHSDIWTGSELVIWGGANINSGHNFLSDGARYNPSTDSWTPISAVNAPSKRALFTQAWSGAEVFIWGGTDSLGLSGYHVLNTGKRYNPINDTWTNISTVAAPSARLCAAGVWTGVYFIVWGGHDGVSGAVNSGARYNAATNTWSSMSTLNAPPVDGLYDRMFWTGSQVVVLGKGDSVRRYNPATNIWTSSAKCPAGPTYSKKTAVWTGSEVWIYHAQKIYKYNPTTNVWTSTNVLGANLLTDYNIINAVWGDNTAYFLVRQKDEEGRFLGNRYYFYSQADNTFYYNELYYNEGTNQESSFVKAGSMLIKWGGLLSQDTPDGQYNRYSRRGIRIYLASGISVPPFYLHNLNNNKLFLYRKN